jgi:SSS family solute:Na+ symporter
MWIISLFTKRPEEEQLKGLVYGLSTPEQIAETRASWNKWDVIHSLIIIGVVVWFYVYFW